MAIAEAGDRKNAWKWRAFSSGTMLGLGFGIFYIGMPVITGTGPVGSISTVFGDYADVTLISDASSSVEVVIPRTGGRGMLTGLGRPDSYACTIQWLERQAPSEAASDARVRVGDEVVTSGLGASFPPGVDWKVRYDPTLFVAESESVPSVPRKRLEPT